MNICVVGPTYPYRGGISHYTTILCQHLEKNHQINLFSFKRLYPKILFPGKSQIDENSKNQIQFDARYTLDSMNPITWLSTAHSIKKLQPDLIILQWWTPFFAPAYYVLCKYLKYSSKSKLLFICHNAVPHESRILDKLLTKLVLDNADTCIVHSTQDRENLEMIIDSKDIRCTMLPTYDVFYSKSFNQDDAKQTLSISGNIILFFGFVRKYKGLKYLLSAFKETLNFIDATLLIVGEFWDDEDQYIEQIELLGIGDNVKIVNEYIPNEDVGIYMASADVVVLPYTTATQSAIIQIAFGFNVPVIATNVGGIPDVIINGKTGYIVESENSVDLSRKIVQYFQNDKKDEFKSNIEQMKYVFSWDRMVELIQDVVGK